MHGGLGCGAAVILGTRNNHIWCSMGLLVNPILQEWFPIHNLQHQPLYGLCIATSDLRRCGHPIGRRIRYRTHLRAIQASELPSQTQPRTCMAIHVLAALRSSTLLTRNILGNAVSLRIEAHDLAVCNCRCCCAEQPYAEEPVLLGTYADSRSVTLLSTPVPVHARASITASIFRILRRRDHALPVLCD